MDARVVRVTVSIASNLSHLRMSRGAQLYANEGRRKRSDSFKTHVFLYTNIKSEYNSLKKESEIVGISGKLEVTAGKKANANLACFRGSISCVEYKLTPTCLICCGI